jgi:hypothetical protein
LTQQQETSCEGRNSSRGVKDRNVGDGSEMNKVAVARLISKWWVEKVIAN